MWPTAMMTRTSNNDVFGGHWWQFAYSQVTRRLASEAMSAEPAPADPWQHLIQARGYRLIGEIEQAEAELAAVVVSGSRRCEVLAGSPVRPLGWDKANVPSPTGRRPSNWPATTRCPGFTAGVGMPSVASRRRPMPILRKPPHSRRMNSTSSSKPAGGWWDRIRRSCMSSARRNSIPIRPGRCTRLIRRPGCPTSRSRGPIVPDNLDGGVVAVRGCGRGSVYALTHVYSPDERGVLLMITKRSRCRLWPHGVLIEDFVPGRSVQPNYEKFHRLPVVLAMAAARSWSSRRRPRSRSESAIHHEIASSFWLNIDGLPSGTSAERSARASRRLSIWDLLLRNSKHLGHERKTYGSLCECRCGTRPFEPPGRGPKYEIPESALNGPMPGLDTRNGWCRLRRSMRDEIRRTGPPLQCRRSGTVRSR